MSIKSTCLAAAAAATLGLPAFAAEIMVKDAYARVSSMMSSSGAAFMVIHNTGDTDDHLVGAASPVADKTELHTHKEDDMGVMRMLHVEEGFALPAGGTVEMARGGKHVMFLGLKDELAHGDTVSVTLQFENAGDVSVEVPVDLERKPDHGQMNHGTHGNHGDMKMSN
jgi:copper(I)-binding protein